MRRRKTFDMITKDILNYQVKYLCRTVEQRDRLCSYLEKAGYTNVGYKYKAHNDHRIDPEMLYIVTKGTTFEILPGNRGTWEHRVPIDARSEGELFALTGIDPPEQMFTREDMIYFSEYIQEFDKCNGQGSGDPKDLFKRKFEKGYGCIKE